jgi:CDP-diacylglycerol---glycerol-3-phosphate 3-phosphatidyltransferase
VTAPTRSEDPAAASQPPGSAAGSPDRPVRAVSVWNIANLLTMLRIALVPVFIAALLHDGGHDSGWRLTAAAVFFLASLTDRFDGELARKRDLITDFGKIADPIADKALMGAALVSLSALHQVWWWVTVVILVRELGITLLRFWVIEYGVIAASRGGKLKTLLQALAIFLAVLPVADWPGGLALSWTSSVIMGAALIVTVVTGVDYVIRAVALRRAAHAPRTKM